MPQRLRLASFIVMAALLMAGCIPPEVAIETATPTTAPATDTAAPPPATDTAAPPPATDTAAAPPATDTPAATAFPTPDPTLETILILEPGLTSSVTSPVRISGEANSTFEQNLVIQVTDQDGAVLTVFPTTIQSELGTRGPFSAEATFSVASDQPGRISVFSTSARDGGLEHLASVEVTLLASGSANIVPAAAHSETHQIYEPAWLATATGGHLHIEGFSDYVFEGTLNLALCGEGGSGAPEPICGTADNLLASGFAMLQAPDIGQPGPFETDLIYAVASPVRARLAVYSLSARDGGLVHLSTVPVTVAP